MSEPSSTPGQVGVAPGCEFRLERTAQQLGVDQLDIDCTVQQLGYSRSTGHKQSRKRNTGSRRQRRKRQIRISRWQQEGITIGTLNIGGLTYFKLYLLMEFHELDILCLQETWILDHAPPPSIPGYQLVESRRQQGTRGGIAMYVRDQLRIVSSESNEYAMRVLLTLPSSERVNVVNVYLPPASSLARRHISEDTGRQAVDEIMACLPHQHRTVVCGDFNARLADLAPQVGDFPPTRTSDDIPARRCPRAQWMITLCELHQLFVLNGSSPRSPAQFTFRNNAGSSAIDYILSSDDSLPLEYDHDSLQALTHHSLLLTRLPIGHAPIFPRDHTPPSPPVALPSVEEGRVIYKWKEGSDLRDYQDAAHIWQQYTDSQEFQDAFRELVYDQSLDNTARSQAVERFLLEAAVRAQVVDRIEIRQARNPNKWDKRLAPWFTDDCREARRTYIRIRRSTGRDSSEARDAARTFSAACNAARQRFSQQLPEMMKFQPKRFWGMLQTKAGRAPLDLAAFAEFNQQLFYDRCLPQDMFTPLEDSGTQAIGVDELELTLKHHFKANKSSGASPMPLQVLKFLGRKNFETLAHFLTDSAICQEAPQSWRDTKVTPLFKGRGDPADMNNYRSIAVTPPFTKLFMSIINQRLTSYADDHGLHAPTQAGFRKHHTTIEQTLILHTLIQFCTRAKKPLGIIFVDLEKAYDRVSRAKLWDCLVQQLGVPPDLVRIICNMYVGSRGSLKDVNGKAVFSFLANIGVK